MEWWNNLLWRIATCSKDGHWMKPTSSWIIHPFYCPYVETECIRCGRKGRLFYRDAIRPLPEIQ